MAVNTKVQRLVAQKSGNRCGFADRGEFCRRLLTAQPLGSEVVTTLGDLAHIVGESPNGPRGASAMTLDERNSESNLMLLCNVHHQLVDAQTATYPVEKLRAMKADHERWVTTSLGSEDDVQGALQPSVSDIVHSTVLPVLSMPESIFVGRCTEMSEAAVKAKVGTQKPLPPYILRGDSLMTLAPLNAGNPLRAVIAPETINETPAREWWDWPEHLGWFVELCNRALNKITGHLGLSLDREHSRYFFPMTDPGKPREVTYKPLNLNTATRSVVWQPKNSRTGEGRGYWYHLAVALRFVRTSADVWCLVVRPELRVTSDGIQPLPADEIGSKVTRFMARRFNYEFLSDVHFWRHFLGGGSSTIRISFGRHQLLEMSTTLLSGQVEWPGIPAEFMKRFKNVSLNDAFDAVDDEGDEDDDEAGTGDTSHAH